MVTAKGRGAGDAFNALAYDGTHQIGFEPHRLRTHLHAEHNTHVAVSHGSAGTQTQRLAALNDAAPVADTPQPLSTHTHTRKMRE